MRSSKFAYLVDYICCSFIPSFSAVTPIVDLTYAQYQGVPFLDPVSKATNTQFLGIRYAAAPTGSLRFREPQRPSSTQDVQLANELPSMCLQAGVGSAPTTPFRNGNSTVPNISRTRNFETRGVDLSVPGGSEDCLFLNVYVPGNLGEKKDLPVVVWIHGGGYIQGSGSVTGNDLIREAGGGVVAVAIQYRLGLFGFLSGEKVKAGGALNAGLCKYLGSRKEYVAQYAGLGTNIFQVNAIMGESIFICPTYFMLRGFNGRAFKGEFAVPPGTHSRDIAFYFPGSNALNTFGKSFSDSFLNFVMTLDTNLKWDSSDITPPWKLWSGTTEMLFNVTESGAPDIRSVTTSSALLERCKFWESVSALSAQ